MAIKKIKTSNSNLKKMGRQKASDNAKKSNASNPARLYNQNKYDRSISDGTNNSLVNKR